VVRVLSLADDRSLRERWPFGPGWPKFLAHDEVARRLIPSVERLFGDLSLMVLEDEDAIIAGGWGVPIRWNGQIDDLPGGWDGALERAVEAHEQDVQANTLCAMATEVIASKRSTGLGGGVLSALRSRGAARGLTRMIAPARPTLKHRYPLTPVERYAAWTRDDGEPFDPWIRTHTRVGARVLATTTQAMRIVASVAEWEEMSGLTFPDTGDYIVPDALCPIQIDRDRDQGVYVEPAIWVEHR
jgi:hypothetical protein